MLDLQIRKIRAALNQRLQNCNSVADIKAGGEWFEGLYGASIWGCKCKGDQTFADLYNAHMQRERENEEDQAENNRKTDNILNLLESCGMPDWYNLKMFIERRPSLMDRQDVLEALEDRRVYLEIPSDEETEPEEE